jgi:hypothetical protein
MEVEWPSGHKKVIDEDVKKSSGEVATVNPLAFRNEL